MQDYQRPRLDSYGSVADKTAGVDGHPKKPPL
jgi:hypothetical protein